MAYAVGSVADAAGFRSRVQDFLNNILPADANARTNSTGEVWGIWSSYLTNKSAFINDLMAVYDSIADRPLQSRSLSAWSVWVAVWNVFAWIAACKVYIWDDRSGIPGDQTSAAQRATDYTNAGQYGGSGVAYFKRSFAWNSTGLNSRPGQGNNANVDNHGCEWYPHTNTAWNNAVATNPSLAQPSALQTGQLVALTASSENTLTALYNEWMARNHSTTAFWNGSTSAQASERVICVHYWCHSNCHSNCHGSRSRR